jgi:phosphatidylglycerophosphate synthase
MKTDRRVVRDVAATAAGGVAMAAVSAIAIGHAYAAAAPAVLAAVIIGVFPAGLASWLVQRRTQPATTPADQVTLARAVLACGCAAVAVLAVAGQAPSRSWWLFALALPTLLLDAVDGAVARRTGTASTDGARLDMEVDACVLLVLTIALAPAVGTWVVLIGALRYLLLVATWLRPELGSTLPRSQFRVFVAGLQAVVVATAIAPVLSLDVVQAMLAIALALLVMSFGTEVATKERLARSAVSAGRSREA